MFLNMVLVVMAIALSGCNNEESGVQQKPVDEPQHQNLSFDFDNAVANNTQFKVDVMPKDKEMEYIICFAEKKHFLMNMIDTREELLEDDYAYFLGLAEAYGLSVHEFLTKIGWLVKGDKLEYGGVNLYPGTEYVVYCYGVEFDKEGYIATTEVNYVVIKTSAPDLIDVKFDVKKNIQGSDISITINPGNYDGLYYGYIISDSYNFYIFEDMEVSEEYIEHYRNRAYLEFNALINDQGIAPEKFCYNGRKTIKQLLEPNTQYQIVLFAVSDDQTPILCSLPQPFYFATEDIKLSDLELSIKVTDIHPYYAEMTVTPSNNTEKYACVHIKREHVPYAESDYGVMKAIIDDFQPAILKGTVSERLMPLMPDSEYTVLAFGIENNLPTTGLFRYDYTSAHADAGKINIESIELVKLFDAAEIIALDRSYANLFAECECLAIVEMKTSAPAKSLYFWWYEEWMIMEYSEEAFLEDLLMYEPSTNPSMMDMYYSMDEDDRFFFAGIAEDDEGNMSPIYYSDRFTLDKSQCAPAEEFFEFISDTRSSNMVLVGRK